jgi:hypothetical protein
MKNSLLAIIAVLFFSCTRKTETVKTSVLHRVVDTLDISHRGNILVYTINPNDCISCLNGFKLFEEQLSVKSEPLIYVIAVNRMAEREALLKELTYPDLRKAKNKAVIWDRQLLDSVNHMALVDVPLTMVAVYNYESDTLIFSSPIRELENMEMVIEKLHSGISSKNHVPAED